MAAAGCGAVVGAHLSIIRKLDVAAPTNPATGAFSAPQSAPNPAPLVATTNEMRLLAANKHTLMDSVAAGEERGVKW